MGQILNDRRQAEAALPQPLEFGFEQLCKRIFLRDVAHTLAITKGNGVADDGDALYIHRFCQ